MTSHILPNSPRNKINQRTKLHQLIEYNMRKIFIQKSYATCGGKTIPRPFFKKNPNLAYLSIKSLFSLYAKLRAVEIY